MQNHLSSELPWSWITSKISTWRTSKTTRWRDSACSQRLQCPTSERGTSAVSTWGNLKWNTITIPRRSKSSTVHICFRLICKTPSTGSSPTLPLKSSQTWRHTTEPTGGKVKQARLSTTGCLAYCCPSEVGWLTGGWPSGERGSAHQEIGP